MTMRLVTHEQLEIENEMFTEDEPVEEQSSDSPAEEPADGAVEDTADEKKSSSAVEIDLAMLEAMLFSTHHPLTAGRLAELLNLESTKPIRGAIKQLNAQYEESNRSFRIEQVAGGYQLLTLPQFGDALKKLHQKEADAKLTKAALETLAIIAYRQPIGRAEIEEIRGVSVGGVLKALLERGLLDIVGRSEGLGRPLLYGTTPAFLEQFALRHLEELPRADELAVALRADPRPL